MPAKTPSKKTPPKKANPFAKGGALSKTPAKGAQVTCPKCGNKFSA
jgi:hypothetical protein